MKHVPTLLAATLIAAGVTVTTPLAAHADTRGCVSRAEYRALHKNMTYKQVKGLLDTNGVEVGRYYDGYWESAWVEDGYWEDGYWDYDGYFDSNDNWVDTSTYVPAEWVDMSYLDEYATWVDTLDTWRSYRKCRSFDRGRGRVGVNFDNYSSASSGMRSFAKTRYTPKNGQSYARSGNPLADKPRPSTSVPTKPHFAPPAAPPAAPKDPAKVALAQEAARSAR